MNHQNIVNRLNHRAEEQRIRKIEEGYAPLWLIIYGMILGIAAVTWMNDADAASAELKLNMLICESGLRYDKCSDGGKSCGIAMFRLDTFNEFAQKNEKKMRKLGMWPPSWGNPQHQLFLLDWGLDNGYGQKRWKVCYKKIAGAAK